MNQVTYGTLYVYMFIFILACRYHDQKDFLSEIFVHISGQRNGMVSTTVTQCLSAMVEVFFPIQVITSERVL
jgi:hypothetical protein